MKQLIINKGKYKFLEVTEPALGPGQVLIRLSHSAVSRGTELQTLRNSKSSLMTKVLEKPGKMAVVLGI